MQLSFASLHLCLLLLAGAVHAAPTPLITRETRIMSRQEAAALTEPTTVQTSNTADTMMGPVTEACVIKLTPVKDDGGKDAVRVEKTCTLQMDGAKGGNQENKDENKDGNKDGNNGGGDAKSSTSASPDASSSSSSGDAASSTASGASSSSSSSASGAASTGTSSSSGAASTTSGSSTASATSSAASSAFSQAALTIKPSGFASGSNVPNPAATGTASSSSAAGGSGGSSATSAADQAATNQPGAPAQQNFALPGTKVSVLPIGLGVFAGISVIALIVVGLVTYERTKYRKAFRQRKLAESGGAMGYGGMAQRQ